MKKSIVFTIMFMMLVITGCQSWIVTDTPPPPTLAPSPTETEAPPIADLPTQQTPTTTPTITLTPRFSPTSPLGPTSTQSEAELTATLNAAIPKIEYFIATPEEASPKDEILLFWKSSGGLSAAVYRLNRDGTPGRTWEVKLEGDLTVFPKYVGYTEVYVLSVTNGVATVEKQVEITITCETDWFFEPAPEEGCPDDFPALSGAIAQEFERGRMFWIESTRQIIVLFDDKNQPAWLLVDDPWFDGMPEEDPNLNPPEGFVEPLRGFGMIWRENPTILERLGWATGGEVPFNMQWQTETIDSDRSRYFNDPANTIIILDPDNVNWRRLGF